MISIGKKASAEDDLTDLMISPHTLSIRVRLLDLDHNYKKDLTPYFVDGQVTIDADAETTRALDLTLLDPGQHVHLDPDEPSATSIFISDQISIIYVVMNPARTKVYEVPVFCGPVSSVERDDVEISVKALGKESLGITNLWNGRTFKEGQEKTQVIKAILRDLMGETKLSIPDRSAKLPNPLKLNRDDAPWKVAQRIAGSMNMQLFYDGRGVATLRKKNNKPVLTLDDKWCATLPNVTYDLTQVINAVEVIGATPKKAKKPLKARAIAGRSHPLSPWRLGRGGQPRYLWVTIQDDSLRTQKECNELANKTLDRGLMAGVSIAVDGIPHPRLQELDVVQYKSDFVNVRAPIRKFMIPLVAGENSTYGYVRKVKPRGGRKPIPRPHHHHHGHHNRKGRNTNNKQLQATGKVV